MSRQWGAPIIGFFTTRLVKARTVDEAEDKAKKIVLTDWTVGEYASVNQGGTPTLKVDAVYFASWWHSLRFKNTGHIFYTESEHVEQSDPTAAQTSDAAAERSLGRA